jgi:hypothetical protein
MNHASSSSPASEPSPHESPEGGRTIPSARLYLSEPGWRIGVKSGSAREFCYMRAPGQDFYHRLLDNEVFLQRDDEKLCLACASRRGLLASEPKQLHEATIPLPADMEAIPLDLGYREVERSWQGRAPSG